MASAYPASGESCFLVWTVLIPPGSCCRINETLHIFYRVTSPFVCGGWDGNRSTHSTPKGYFNSATLRLGFSMGLGVTEHSGNSGSQSSEQSSSLYSPAPFQLPISCWPCSSEPSPGRIRQPPTVPLHASRMPQLPRSLLGLSDPLTSCLVRVLVRGWGGGPGWGEKVMHLTLLAYL